MSPRMGAGVMHTTFQQYFTVNGRPYVPNKGERDFPIGPECMERTIRKYLHKTGTFNFFFSAWGKTAASEIYYFFFSGAAEKARVYFRNM